MTADPRAVEIIGVAIRDHETSEYHVKTYDDGPGWATTCECGWSVRGEDYAAWDAHRAESVAVALSAAGWSLLPRGLPQGHDGDHDELIDGELGNSWPQATAGPSVSGQPTPEIVSGEYDDAAAQNGPVRPQTMTYGELAEAYTAAHDEVARLRSQLAEAREALCQPGAIRCKAGKQAILSVSGTGHDGIAKVVAERDELLAALNRFRDVVDFSEATTHMDVAEIVVHHIRSQAADLSLFRSESDLELTAAMRERDAATEAHTRLVAEVRNAAEAWERLADEALDRRNEARAERDRSRHEAVSHAYRACANTALALLAATPPEAPAGPHGCDDQCGQAAEHGLHPPMPPTPPCGHRSGIHDEYCDVINDPGGAADELDEALAGAMSAIEWAANHISLARTCARAALPEPPAAPVQPEEGGGDWEPGDPVYDEQQRELIELATLRGEREWLTAKARDIGLSHVVIDAHGPAAAIVGEIGRLRAALATAERERDEARDQWRIEIGLRQALGANYDALHAEVQRIAEDWHDNGQALTDASEIGMVYREGAKALFAALGSTPDTGSTDG